jgi:phosphate transport system permease protein
MTAVTTASRQPERSVLSLSGRKLPRWATPVALVVAVAVAVPLGLALHGKVIATVVLALLIFLVGYPLVSLAVEGRRRATDRLVTTAVSAAFAITMVPLLSLLYVVIEHGAARLDGTFFTETMRNVIGPGGGALHAIVGTLEITLGATVLSVPIGLLTAVYLTEYGRGSLARTLTFLVDVMTGIPSIVAGLFVYALFVLIAGPATQNGFMGSVALAVLMIPVVVRSSESMFRLVPMDLREAAYALGVPKWLTIVKVVIPTAAAGVATGITLAIARVIGETAPLLVTVGISASMNTDLFHGAMATLSSFTYFQYTQPGFPAQGGLDRAWASALTLIIVVLVLNLIARFVAAYFSPKAK